MHMQCRTAGSQPDVERWERRRFATALAMLWMAGVLPAPVVHADEHAEQPDHQVKAAFLYKFPSYIEWPPEVVAPRAPLVIAVIGDEEVARALHAVLAQRSGQGDRPVSLRTVAADGSLDGVHLLYVGGSESARIRSYAQRARQQAMLLVTDATNALNDGSMINFLRVRDRVRFEISLEAAERARLRISARLLAVAYRVEKGTL